jgi:glycosyltransferase involved in cell wall biosynthesis
MKRIFIHSPYWLTRGGGERYSLTAAECLSEDFEVLVDAPSNNYLTDVSMHLGINLERVKILPGENFMKNMSKFYGVFWVSDGSIPLLLSKRKVIHFQAPFKNVDGKSFKNRLKLLGVRVISNSFYTKGFIDKEYGVDSQVIYPPVEVEKFEPIKKQKLILTVGRFSRSSQHKRPEILIRSFKHLVDGGLSGFRMSVVGIVEDEESGLVAVGLRTLAKGYPIAIRTNLNHERLIRLYEQAAIYWHAAGFGVDLDKNPERAEHFGISAVEAMAAGAVPVVFAAGGPKEAVRSGKDGLWWQTLPELERQTLRLINDESLRQSMANEGRERAKLFSKKRFCQEAKELFR